MMRALLVRGDVVARLSPFAASQQEEEDIMDWEPFSPPPGLAPPTELEPVAVSPIDPVTKEEAGQPLLCFLRPLFP